MTQEQLRKDWIIPKTLTDKEVFVLIIMAENAGIPIWDLAFNSPHLGKYPVCHTEGPGGRKICRWLMGTSKMYNVTYEEVIEAMKIAIKRREVWT